jgi:glucans biosynthesis protein
VFYEKRPSAWVEPLGRWGAGSVQLVELPTSGETEDNIVAFWTPAQTTHAGAVLRVRYRLYWTDEEPAPIGVARVVATRSGRAGAPGQPLPPGRRRFAVDFAGGRLSALRARGDAEPVVSASHGQPTTVAAYPIVGQPGWRLIFDIKIDPARPPDLRAYLRRDGAALTETWLYQPPPR